MAKDTKQNHAHKGRRLTLPLFSLAYNPYMEVQLDSDIREQVMPGLSTHSDKPVQVITVTNLESGEQGVLILPTLVATAIANLGVDVVGRKIIIERGEQVKGKRYHSYEIYEMAE